MQNSKTLLEWTAKSRPFTQKSRDFYVAALAIATLVGLILFLAEGIMPVLLMIALVFLYYTMHTVEPEDILYIITSEGIKIGKTTTPWEMMGRYWFSNKAGSEILNIETATLTGRLELVIDPAIKEKVHKILGEKLINEEIAPNFLDKAATWASKKLPQ